LLAFSTAGDQVGLSKKIKMVGNGWLRHVENINKVADTLLAFVLQNLQNALPGSIAKRLAEGNHVKICHSVITT
jgi:hypothetical protein